ncbi:MAG: hypothetical protein WBM44_25855 [Waterburya sp.]
MQMLKNLFNSDKKYYLELGEAKDSQVVQNAVKTATEVTDTVKEKAAEVAKSQPVKEAVKKATEVAESAQEQLASAITEEKPAETKAKSKQNGKAAKSTAQVQKTKATPTKATPTNSGASSYEPPFWVAAMYKNNSSATNNNGKVATKTFATDNLMPTVTTYRRRPGGSLAKFQDMARKANTPRRG